MNLENVFETSDKDFSKIKNLPEIRRLRFKSNEVINKPLIFPETISELELQINSPLNFVKFPKFLTHLVFGKHFNQDIEDVTFPPTLISITFGRDFNQPIHGVKFPSSLQSITFGQDFNQYI